MTLFPNLFSDFPLPPAAIVMVFTSPVVPDAHNVSVPMALMPSWLFDMYTISPAEESFLLIVPNL
jgi:hypothetical protein